MCYPSGTGKKPKRQQVKPIKMLIMQRQFGGVNPRMSVVGGWCVVGSLFCRVLPLRIGLRLGWSIGLKLGGNHGESH
jgi:hypothetical protein